MFVSDEDLKKLYPPKISIIEELQEKDKEIILADFKIKKEIILSIRYDELKKLNVIYDRLGEILINFKLLPMYFELYFCINYGMQDIDTAIKYLRSLKVCIDKFENLEDDAKESEDIIFFEKTTKNYIHYIELLKLEYNYSEYGKKDRNINYYLPEEEFVELTKKEIAIRILMRKGKLTRIKAIEFIDKIENKNGVKKKNYFGI